MAGQLANVTRTFQKLTLAFRCRVAAVIINPNNENDVHILTQTSTRNTNFFNKLPAQDLWKGITSVSNAGKKRGRGKNVSKSKIKDLNRGQIIGVGKANIVWPGLSAPIIRGKELVEQHQLPEDPEREKKLIQIRDSMGTSKRPKLSPLERGWSGAKLPGRSIGPPDPIEEETFEGFDTKVLELKTVFNMKGNFGRKRRQSALVVTGNGKGLAGFALTKGAEAKTALRKAKNRAAQKLMHIKLYRNHTVCHDFFTQFGTTKIYVWQKPEGHGLICHRAIKTICEVVGIKNLHAKVEGSTNVGKIMKAFFLGLIKQKTPEEIAEEKKLHLVEFCKENNYFPNIIASPKECRKLEEIPKDEILDYKQYCFDGRVVLKKKKYPPFYATYKSYELYLKKQEKIRNQNEVRRNLRAEYGEIRSHLADKYPECKQYRSEKKENVDEENEQ
ncbi:28S ribosomal protein S5, mitochondrial [Diorhabda carinulata]|uniref:28S ribosomal protein S5, mitochondrial n=1 Tax=Diorhabda carinulata TaxID=1163345 RepID=UPI0025A2EAB4|nr:28S ribosomal protein S5, mitochondrial [Diorhabda carinulata]